LFKGVFSWEIRGSRFVPCAVRFAIVSIAVLYTGTVSVTKGVNVQNKIYFIAAGCLIISKLGP